MEHETITEVLKVISNPIRRKVIGLLARQKLSYIEILTLCGLNIDVDCGWLNYHLRILSDYSIVLKDELGYCLTSFGENVSDLLSVIERESHKIFKSRIRILFEKPVEKGNLSVSLADLDEAYDVAIMKRTYFLEEGGSLVDESAIVSWVEEIKGEIESGFCAYTQLPWFLVPQIRKYVVARLDGELVGYVSIIVHPTLGNPIYSFIEGEDYVAHIDEAFVKRTMRGERILEYMLQGALDYIRELEIEEESKKRNETLKDLSNKEEVTRIANKLTTVVKEYLPPVKESEPHVYWFKKIKKIIEEKKGTSKTMQGMLDQILYQISEKNIPEKEKQTIIDYLMQRPAKYKLTNNGTHLNYVILTTKEESIKLYKKLGFHSTKQIDEFLWMNKSIRETVVFTNQ